MTTPPRPAPPRPGCRASRTSSRPTTRRPTSRASSRRRSRRCRRSPRRSRSSRSTTARRTAPGEIADRLAAEHPDVVRVVHHDVNRGYGGALRSGFEASRYELLAFTDGDRQFRVADLGRLTARLAEADHPDVVVGYRIKRADPFIRIVVRPDLQAGQPDLLRPAGPRRGLRLQAVPPRGARGRPRRVRRRLLLGRAADQDPPGGPLDRRGRACRTTRARPARPTGARPSVIWRAVKDFWMLRLRLWANRDAGDAAGPADPGRVTAPLSPPGRRGGRGSAAASRPERRRVLGSSEFTNSRKMSRRRGVDGARRSPRASLRPCQRARRVARRLRRPRPRRPSVLEVGQRGGLVEHVGRRRRSAPRGGPPARSRRTGGRPPRAARRR